VLGDDCCREQASRWTPANYSNSAAETEDASISSPFDHAFLPKQPQNFLTSQSALSDAVSFTGANLSPSWTWVVFIHGLDCVGSDFAEYIMRGLA